MVSTQPITPAQAIQAFFRKRFDFESRARRSEFWWVQLVYFLVGLVAANIDTAILGYPETQIATPAILLVEIAFLIPLTSLTARRLHDVGLTGWAQLPAFILYIEYVPGYEGFIFDGFEKGGAERLLAVLMCIYLIWILFYFVRDGGAGVNRFGENPKEPPFSDTFD